MLRVRNRENSRVGNANISTRFVKLRIILSAVKKKEASVN